MLFLVASTSDVSHLKNLVCNNIIHSIVSVIVSGCPRINLGFK
jgi:hypothetical protein